MITFTPGRRIAAIAGSAALLAGLGSAAATGPVHAAAKPAVKTEKSDNQGSCHLGNGVKHVVQLTFDNVHFFRDNPNVPSDLQLMPNLLHFIEGNGTMLSNNHTPLIAHTADDILTTFTGLYGDRQGMPIANDYKAYNTDGPGGTFGTTDPAVSFAYWTDPVYDTAKSPSPGHDTNPSMVYSPVPPATAKTPVSFDGEITVAELSRELLGRAEAIAGRSSDWWRQVGAVAARDGRVLGCAWNRHHPTEYAPYLSGDPRDAFERGVRADLSTAIHAEAALIAGAARDGTSLAGADLYTTTFPCPACARLIAEAGFLRCFFAGQYSVLDGEQTLRARGISLIWVDTRGGR